MKIVLSSICLETASDLQLALYYLKSYLLKHCRFSLTSADVPVRVFRETGRANHIARIILKEKPAAVGFSCYLWNITKTLAVCRLLKKAKPGIVIILGGPEASPRAEAILVSQRSVDVVVRGEGELTFCRLLEAFNCGDRSLSGVKGISFRRQGKTVSTPDRENIRHLDHIPSPYLNGLVDLKDKAVIDVPLETTRGCSFRCRYCYYHKNFPRMRFFPLKRVAQELKLILSARPAEVYLMDATFNADRSRAMKILGLFRKYNRGSSLHVELMAELVDERMARALAQANASNIEIGLQSGNPRTLRLLDRPFNRDRFVRGIQLLNRYGLIYEIQLIDALPGQTYADILAALDWLYALPAAKVELFSLSVLAGTSLAQDARRYGIAYSAKPPYRARQSRSMTAKEVLRCRRLRFAMDRLYDSGVFRETLFALRDQAGIKISQVIEDWIAWESSTGRPARGCPQRLNHRLPDFLGFILRKRGLMSFYPQLAAGLKRRLSEYRRLYGS